VSVAYGKIKKDVENPAVARSIFFSLISYLRKEKATLYDKNVLMTGYGSIGSVLADLLKSISKKLWEVNLWIFI
jgi:phosphoglycerate dehydrogenase-like enzyme